MAAAAAAGPPAGCPAADGNPLYNKEQKGANGAEPPKLSAKQTLYMKLGGAGAVAAAVDIFYKKVLADPDLLPFFENVDMVTLIAKQNRFLAFAFGATTHYSGKDIVMGHAHLIVNRGLNQTHFDKVAGHFVDSLKELNVPQDLIDESAGVLLAVRPLFDPARYKGKIDVDKIEKSAQPGAAAASTSSEDKPVCCSMM